MFLGLDLGTTNVKALVIDDRGRLVGEGSAQVDCSYTSDGGVEQDIEQIWDSVGNAIRQATVGELGRQVRAVGVSSQGGALQLLDAQTRPLGRVISWLDGRGGSFDARLVDEVGPEYLVEHLGCRFSTMTLGQVLRLREQCPQLWARVHHIGFVGDVIVQRLCGRRAHDPTSLSIAMLYNPRLKRSDPEILVRLGLEEEQLPDLLPATCPAGVLRTDVARWLGVPAGIPVSPAVHDQYAASTGAGSVAEGDVCLATGTAWVLLANTPCLAPPVGARAFVCPHPVEGLVGQLLSMVNGGSAIAWMLRILGRDEHPSAAIDEALAAAPPTSEGLCFWPLLVSTGSRSELQGDSGGRLTGITLAHKPCHLLRAAIEGLACELARNLGFLTAAGLPVRRTVMCGGASSSQAIPQIIADVTGHLVSCIDEPSTSARGAATIARALVEPATPLGTLATQLAPPTRLVRPGAGAARYAELLHRYLQAFTDHHRESATCE